MAISTITGASLGSAQNIALNSITFPATQVPSANPNTLDDYEEGTWTPSLLFNGAGVGISYTDRTGTYVKVGKLVTLQGYLSINSAGSSTGSATIAGLPYSVSSAALTYGGSAVSHWGGISSFSWVAVYTNPGTSALIVSGGNPPSSTNSSVTNSNFGTTYMLFVTSYFADN